MKRTSVWYQPQLIGPDIGPIRSFFRLSHGRPTMPMIDVYAAADLFPAGADRQLAEELTAALLKAEGVEKPGPTHLNNTGAYIHRMPPSTVNTAGSGSARTVRVQVLTPP